MGIEKMEEMHRAYYAIIPATVRYDKSLCPNAKLLYGEISALCNETGYCWATNEYFSTLYGVSKVSISKWISSLIQGGHIESDMKYKEGTKKIEYRYLRIPTTPIKEKLNTPLRKVKYPIKEKFKTPIKEKFKENNTVSNNTSNITLDINTITSEFKRLWDMYPNKKGRTNALKAFEKAVKDGTPIADIEAGIIAYNAEITAKKTEKKYIKHGSTWFNQQAWNDEYETAGGNMNGKYSGSGEVTAKPERTLGTFV